MSNAPHAIGLIMDGNRRWARSKGLPSFEGHRKGAQKVEEVVSWAREAGVKELVFYVFSTENWNRPPEEVEYLMTLSEELFTRYAEKLAKSEGRMRFIGDRSRLSEHMQRILREAEENTQHNDVITVTFAFSYGGRTEILHAVNALLTEGKKEITEAEFSDALWTRGLQDPDLIIRTGGEQRLSNFLTWQSTYSELYFSQTPWPEFSKEEFVDILTNFTTRERRNGK